MDGEFPKFVNPSVPKTSSTLRPSRQVAGHDAGFLECANDLTPPTHCCNVVANYPSFHLHPAITLPSTMEASVPAYDLESSPVPGQLATAVLDLQGTLIRGQKLPEEDASILFEMFSQSSQISSEVQRLCVSFSGYRYVVTRDETHVYIVQTRTE
mmetsp:Transcript_18201/g.34536  ORF Transcript_18201/g.34536 Transcript_18201/m.34536 type:complete len:155 (-) Transcript_18201:421-885(-)